MAAAPQEGVPSSPPRAPSPTPAVPAVRWPIGKEHYELLDVIGSGATAVVQVALCIPLNQKVAIKRIDLERCGSSIEEIQKEISLMSNCSHPNVITYRASFVVKDELWLVMKLMSGGSLLDIIKHVAARGNKGGVLDEVVIATVLKSVLQGLVYFHSNGQIHRDMKSGNILVGEDGSIQLADFGVSNWLYDSHTRGGTALGKGGSKKGKPKPRNTFVGTPCWMAPEVMDQSVGYNEKADIWSFGITALEMATGTAPYAKFPPMKVLMLTLENPPPTLETCGDLNGDDYKKNYSKSFQKMVEKCLQREPDKRPSATELLKSPFFKKARNEQFIKDVVVGDSPSLASRAKKVRRVPGSSGRLHRAEDGGWVWSDDEMVEEYEGEGEKPDKKGGSTEGGGGEAGKSETTPKKPVSATPPITTSTHAPPSTAPPSTASLPMNTTAMPTSAVSVPTIVVPPQAGAAPPPNATQLAEQLRLAHQQLQQLDQQLLSYRQQQQTLVLMQQQNPALFTQEHHTQAMILLESVQALERQRHQLMFQQQQIALSLQQAKDTQFMQQQLQQMKLQRKPAVIKLALRKRTEQNQLKDIKFDFVPGQDAADSIAKDLVAAGLVDGRNLVIVAANIAKLVENPSLEKCTFAVATPTVTTEQIDDKKLIGYALLSIVHDKQS